MLLWPACNFYFLGRTNTPYIDLVMEPHTRTKLSKGLVTTFSFFGIAHVASGFYIVQLDTYCHDYSPGNLIFIATLTFLAKHLL